MNNDVLILVVSLALSILVIALIIILVVANNNYSKKVLNNSGRIDKLLKLNEKTSFNEDIETKFKFSNACNSKAQLDRFNMESYLIVCIQDNLDVFVDCYKKIEENIKDFKKYLNKVNSLKSTITEAQCAQLMTNVKKFKKREDKLFNKRVLRKPISSLKVRLHASYTSPKGRNHYWQNLDVEYDEFVEALHETINLIEKRQTRQYQIKVERSKLSDSLRYDVMKRDGFKCVICGSSADDGVKLHVDHIIPVSKGGKTEMSNLRTLCDRCNLGKRDKLE